MEIVVFTLNGCYHCTILKKELNNENIKFIEVEIGSNSKIWDKVVEQTGHNVLPTVFIKMEGTDDGPVFIPGKDFNTPEELITKLKKLT